MRTRTRSILSLAATLVLFLLGGVTQVAAQTRRSDPGVVVMNDNMQVMKVYAVQPNGDRDMLGVVGNGELEFFRVPADDRTADGYRIGVQAITPLPQLGVTASPHEFVATPLIEPEPNEVVKVVVAEDLTLSTATVH